MEYSSEKEAIMPLVTIKELVRAGIAWARGVRDAAWVVVFAGASSAALPRNGMPTSTRAVRQAAARCTCRLLRGNDWQN